ncbi:hypothetical protein LCGC14_1432780 [marine sediment metagenome]|uniref:Uncharacterized protein n=1 Tax=marine sediment metagenome TaxID=412755 RepID=A0A0F9M3J1_9ZZZZ
MKIKVSIVYFILYVLGVIAAGVLTGIYGNDISIYISYGFLAAYGIMILINATIIERISSIKVESYEQPNQLTPEQIKELPDKLGKGEEKKVGETTLEEMDAPPEPPQGLKEEPKKVQLSEEEIKTIQKVSLYIKDNLEKGHTLEKIREILEKVYTPELIDFVLQNALQIKEPELPDMGEPEEIVTPKTLNKEIKKTKKKPGRPKKNKVEIVDPEHFQ